MRITLITALVIELVLTLIGLVMLPVASLSGLSLQTVVFVLWCAQALGPAFPLAASLWFTGDLSWQTFLYGCVLLIISLSPLLLLLLQRVVPSGVFRRRVFASIFMWSFAGVLTS